MGEQKKLQKRKFNNKGMTLVEVLVAIAVFTVVSMALLQAFVSSVNYNKEAKEKQRGINLAQSVMETYKAYKLEDICRQFSGVDAFKMYQGTIGSFSEAGGSVDPYGVFTPSPTNEYAFSMQDVVYDGNVYDISITMKPNSAAVSTEALAQTPRFNAYNDAIFSQPADEYKYVYQDAIHELELAGMKTTLVPTMDTLDKSKIVISSRTITVNISNASGAECVDVVVTYEYSFDDYEITLEDDTTDILNSSHTVTVDSTDDATTYGVYNNAVTRTAGASLENVYIYYYPAYPNNLLGCVCENDSISIVNNSGKQRNVFLVKQINPGLGVGAGLYNSETSYHPYVSLTGANGISLYHNIKKNLKDDSGTTYSLSYRSAGSAVDTLHDEWYDKEPKILVYDTEITVTDKKKSEVVIVLDGTVNDR